MGWFKKVISVIFKFTLIGAIISLLTPKAPKVPVPPVAGTDADAAEAAAMKQMEEANMTEEEKQAKAKNDLKLVINGAKVQCTMCSNPMGTLLATNNTPSIQGQPTAIVKDKQKINLIFAGTCLKVPNTPTPCISLIQPGQWQDTGSYKVQGESPLLLKSTIKCMFGGVDIKITDCGQRSSFVYDAPTEMEEAIDENSEMRIALFFDGTRNNMKNTEAREEYFKLHKKRPYENDDVASAGADLKKVAIYEKMGNKDDDSYENGYSNVALLSKYYKKETSDQENLRDYIYVEGIATGNREHEAYVKDNFWGYTIAMGTAGIVAKVEKGCDFAATKIKKLKKRSKILRQITIDVFGFSRGAASARHFLHELSQLPRPAYVKTVAGHSGVSVTHYTVPATPRYGKFGKELEKKGVDISSCHIIIRFAGLYDTVSSHGLSFDKKGNTEKLGLDAIRLAKNTLHLTSADEHRYFFPLVNINSVGFKEKVFPGVHSDIGGSYVDNDPEVKKALAIGLSHLVEEKFKKVVREGWYKSNQLKIIKPSFWKAYVDALILKPVHSPVKYAEGAAIRLEGTKKSISVAYSYIFLHIMCKYSMEEKGIYMKFKNDPLKRKYNLKKHSKLQPISERLNNVVFKDEPEMVFYTRKGLEKEIEKLRPGGPFLKYKEQLWNTDDPIRLEGEAGEPILIEPFITDPDLIRKIEDHNTLLWLRNEYLHWSADWLEPGFNPTGDGKRIIHAG